MEQRELGREGLTVSAVGFGAMVLSPGVYGQVDDEESIRTLRAAVDQGITFIDTARFYGQGHNEALVGRAVAGRREDVVLATKGGLTGAVQQVVLDGSPGALRENLQASLRDLGTDHVDLYYLHAPDPKVPVEDSIGAMAQFVADGLTRYIGVSNFSLDQIRRAHAVHPVIASQDQYSLLFRAPEEQGRLALLRELGIGLVAYSPLANGALAGALARPAPDGAQPAASEPGDVRAFSRRFAGDEGNRVSAMADAFGDVARREGLAPATLALAWLLAQGLDVVPIPGTRRSRNLAASLEAPQTQLSAGLLAELDQAFPPAASLVPMF